MDAIWRAGWRDDPRCSIVYNAIDVSRFQATDDVMCVRTELGVPAGARLFLHVGNEVLEKNHPRLLAIFEAIARVDPTARLVLVGARTERPDGTCGRLLGGLSAARRVVALGVRDDVPRLLAAADVLLLPSLLEGLPGVVLEACAAGVPVLATDLPGVREIAARLPLVRRLSLAAGDDEWAAAALELSAEASALALRDRAAESLRASVFHIDRAVDAYRALWGGGAERSAHACS
jgi:glycosyltransferase involved in cell wall biosynthesis